MPSHSLFARAFSPVPYVYLTYCNNSTPPRGYDSSTRILLKTTKAHACQVWASCIRHSRIAIVIFLDGAKNYWPNISKKNNSERIDSKFYFNSRTFGRKKWINWPQFMWFSHSEGIFLDKMLYICKQNKVHSNIIDYESKSFSLFSFSSLYEQC